ncbi:unnamed protein product [Caenorhabditis nigoni]
MRSSSVNVLMAGIAACDLSILGLLEFLNAIDLLESINEWYCAHTFYKLEHRLRKSQSFHDDPCFMSSRFLEGQVETTDGDKQDHGN